MKTYLLAILFDLLHPECGSAVALKAVLNKRYKRNNL